MEEKGFKSRTGNFNVGAFQISLSCFVKCKITFRYSRNRDQILQLRLFYSFTESIKCPQEGNNPLKCSSRKLKNFFFQFRTEWSQTPLSFRLVLDTLLSFLFSSTLIMETFTNLSHILGFVPNSSH